MNKYKVREPFHYPDTILLLLDYTKFDILSFAIQTDQKRIVQEHAKWKVSDIHDYSTISRRINRLEIKIKYKKNNEFEYENSIIAIYSRDI